MISSPLRYPGGKAKLFPLFSDLVIKNGLTNSLYCEPFAGGAGLAIKLLTTGYVSRISINDIDVAVFSFWKSAFNHTSDLCRLVEKSPINIQEWRKQKRIYDQGDGSDPVSLGFAAYYLNRTNRSGILDGAGPIGGFGQNGQWKMDARFVKDRQIANLLALSRFASAVEISNLDAQHYIKRKFRLRSAFLYLDPPYFVKGQKLYKNFYQHDDHAFIAALLAERRNHRWVVSYDDAPEIRKLYSSFSTATYLLNYSAGEKGVGQEIMFSSDTVEIPDIKLFHKIAA